MDRTNKLKEIILNRYGSIREFSKIVEIPSTTLTSALDKGIGGMAVDRVIKICDILNIDIKTFDSLESSNISHSFEDESLLINNFNKLNKIGKLEAIKRVSELTEINKYVCKDSINSLDELSCTLAAHDDDLTEAEKIESDKRILELLKKRNK